MSFGATFVIVTLTISQRILNKNWNSVQNLELELNSKELSDSNNRLY